MIFGITANIFNAAEKANTNKSISPNIVPADMCEISDFFVAFVTFLLFFVIIATLHTFQTCSEHFR